MEARTHAHAYAHATKGRQAATSHEVRHSTAPMQYLLLVIQLKAAITVEYSDVPSQLQPQTSRGNDESRKAR